MFKFFQHKSSPPKIMPEGPLFQGKKKALCVGINAYEGSNALRGCVNDAREWWEYLVDHDFYVRVLIDSRATGSAIYDRLVWLTDNTNPGDILIFSYSGHGTQVRDRDGDELEDHKDECIVPIDHSWDSPFIDDIFYRCACHIHPEARMYFIFDCCHSGTMIRNGLLSEPNNESGNRYFKARYLEPPFDIQAREGKKSNLPLISSKTLFADLPNVICLSACQDNQTASESVFDGKERGAFTYYLMKHLKEEQDITIGKLITRVSDSLRRDGFLQEPVLTAPSEMKSKPFLT